MVRWNRHQFPRRQHQCCAAKVVRAVMAVLAAVFVGHSASLVCWCASGAEGPCVDCGVVIDRRLRKYFVSALWGVCGQSWDDWYLFALEVVQ